MSALPPAPEYLLYDGECPVCSRYVAWADVQASRPRLKLLDARMEPALVAELRDQGIEINDTMVLSADGKLLVGAEALAALSRLAAMRSRWPRLWNIPARPGLARALYPFLVACRKALLRLRGRTLI